MPSIDTIDQTAIKRRLIEQVQHDDIRLTIHAHQEMAEDDISYDDLQEALINGSVIENYPDYQRGPCCLICGKNKDRYIHVVCTTSLAIAVIITVYEPLPPKWITPFRRRER